MNLDRQIYSRRDFLKLSATALIASGCMPNINMGALSLKSPEHVDYDASDQEIIRLVKSAKAGDILPLDGAQIAQIVAIRMPMTSNLVEPVYYAVLANSEGDIYANVFGAKCLYQTLSEWNQGELLGIKETPNPNTAVWFPPVNTRLDRLSAAVNSEYLEGTPASLKLIDGIFLDMPLIC